MERISTEESPASREVEFFAASELSHERAAPSAAPEAEFSQGEGADIRVAASGWCGEALSFGHFRLLLRRRELLRHGKPVAIGNRAMDVLIALIEAEGELLTKDDLLDRVWPNTIVEENNLQFQISTLRKVLGEDRDLIKTASGRGYRFVGEVRAEPAGPRVRGGSMAAGPTGPLPGSMPAGKPVLAVLAFDNLSADPAQDCFVRAIIEDLRATLSRCRSFSVVAGALIDVERADARRAAAAQGVRYAIRGSFRRTGERVRVTVELIDVASGVHMWGDHFDGEASEQFDFQDRITGGAAALIERQIREATGR